MLDLDLFRPAGFVGVSLATFCIGAGMLALFPYLSIYLRRARLLAARRRAALSAADGVVFVVPLLMRSSHPEHPAAGLTVGLVLVAVAILLMHGLTPSSSWTALPWPHRGGIGIGLVNPTIAAAALRAVDPSRTGIASGSTTPAA